MILNEKCTWVFKMNWPVANQLYLYISVLWFFLCMDIFRIPYTHLSTLIKTHNSCLLNQGFHKIKLTMSIYCTIFNICLSVLFAIFSVYQCFIHLVGVSYLAQSMFVLGLYKYTYSSTSTLSIFVLYHFYD